MRGIGTIATSPGVEPSVSTVLDGVVLARPGQATADILDLDHVEVMRGPQGTLFGKNASAGAVNIVTRQPTADFHAFAEASYFSGNEYRLTGGATGTLVPSKLVANASFLVGGFDGNVKNLANSTTVNGYEHRGARSKFLWTPDEETQVTFGLDYMYQNDLVPTGVYTSTNQVAYLRERSKPTPHWLRHWWGRGLHLPRTTPRSAIIRKAALWTILVVFPQRSIANLGVGTSSLPFPPTGSGRIFRIRITMACPACTPPCRGAGPR